jgi:adenosylcobinamide kinase/adenosylcobinamide-phosphate guanylyltransferase
MGKLTLLLGGARSGKSTYAQTLAHAVLGPVLYLATARAEDAEMERRIAAHQAERPASWQTRELSAHLAASLTDDALAGIELVLLDCLTMLTSNVVVDAAPDIDNPDELAVSAAVEAEISALIARIETSACAWVIVSNEVGLGLVPPYPAGRVYRDELGRANQRLARLADEVFFLVAGIPVPIHQFRPPAS